MITRHIEFTINYDFTTSARNIKDFENDTLIDIQEELQDYISNNASDFIGRIKICNIWYENT